jgi:hypothetical protein
VQLAGGMRTRFLRSQICNNGLAYALNEYFCHTRFLAEVGREFGQITHSCNDNDDDDDGDDDSYIDDVDADDIDDDDDDDDDVPLYCINNKNNNITATACVHSTRWFFFNCSISSSFNS